jgi:hypothetical protein
VSHPITLPDGTVLNDDGPIVVVGPNGSGKTRQTRKIQVPHHIEFINALRNTHVASELPPMGTDAARQRFSHQKNQSRSKHWELEADFDSMLQQMLAEHSSLTMELYRQYRADPGNVTLPELTSLTRMEDLWADIYPGRQLHWRDLKPVVITHSPGSSTEYSANQMSDGEKAVMYLAGRVFTAPSGVLVVDEPETHMHSLLAVKLWNALEDARPDIRFVYVTHDLTFALSRRDAKFVLASPLTGLRIIALDQSLPSDVTEPLLGSASLSFYASRVVFCEGESTSLDSELYNAWFSGPDTVVRAVGNCHRVMRCVDALANGGLTSGLHAVGIVDGDFHPQEFTSSLTEQGLHVLRVHEVESLLCIPGVVEAVCTHVSRDFNTTEYRTALAKTVNGEQRHKLIIERWKRRMEPRLEALVSNVSGRNKPVDEIIKDLPEIFDYQKWVFSPEEFLREERSRIESAIPAGSIDEILSIVPGKQLLPVAAQHAGMTIEAYTDLVIAALRVKPEHSQPLSNRLEAELTGYLPARHASVTGLPLVCATV